MGRKLRDELPSDELYGEEVTEAYWQQKLRERYARSKLRQMEYADGTRRAKYSDIKRGNKVLLRLTRDSSHPITSSRGRCSVPETEVVNMTGTRYHGIVK